jgi:hypothetical protein
MTQIEQALFLNGRAHWVSSFTLSAEALVITVHPAEMPNVCCHARFSAPRVDSVDDSYNEEDKDFPWDIIGFDSERLSDGRWNFCLHTDKIEYGFESDWPEIWRAPV